MPHVDDVVEDSEPEREQRRRRDDVTDDQSDTILQLSRFTYKPTHSSSRTPDPGPSRPAALVSKDPPDHLPDSQLAQLSKCISCGLAWTSRKTAKQKRAHIVPCAKKHALTKDTIKVLVEKEITGSSQTQHASSRIDPNETTLMDSVVPTGPVKKSKRQQVLPSVKSLPETRDNILNRARDILGSTNGLTDPEPTQQFGQSALARRNTQHLNPKRPALLDVNGSMAEPPSTQPFGPSALRGGTTTAEQSVAGYEQSSFLRVGASLFAQDSVQSGNRHKRPASPPPLGNNSRTMRQRLQ
ncbi:hypothetical protein OG21DRAFT_1495092 [Imleria badia]|nr:hypothetical protein OG21DRAFT_1495092 [Imleria badia]